MTMEPMEPGYGHGSGDRPATRTGPPWEQPGGFLDRYIATAKGALLDPQAFFDNMRRQGGLGAPLVYAMLGMFVGFFINIVLQQVLPFPRFGMGPVSVREPAVGFGIVAAIFIVPCLSILFLFVGSGIIHLVLNLLGGAKQGFETTFRVIAYTHGSTGPLAIIPVCGGFIAMIWGLIVEIIGLARSHEISPGVAAAAVLIPMAICCVLIFFVWAIAFAAIMAMLGRAASQ
jgi:hypothetical protein